MAYQNVDVWKVASARKTQGLGNPTITDLTVPPRDTSNLLQFEPGVTQVTPAESSFLQSLSTLITPTQPTYQITGMSIPVSTPPATSGVTSSQVLEYAGIAVAGIILLALLGGRRRS